MASQVIASLPPRLAVPGHPPTLPTGPSLPTEPPSPPQTSPLSAKKGRPKGAWALRGRPVSPVRTPEVRKARAHEALLKKQEIERNSFSSWIERLTDDYAAPLFDAADAATGIAQQARDRLSELASVQPSIPVDLGTIKSDTPTATPKQTHTSGSSSSHPSDGELVLESHADQVAKVFFPLLPRIPDSAYEVLAEQPKIEMIKKTSPVLEQSPQLLLPLPPPIRRPLPPPPPRPSSVIQELPPAPLEVKEAVSPQPEPPLPQPESKPTQLESQPKELNPQIDQAKPQPPLVVKSVSPIVDAVSPKLQRAQRPRPLPQSALAPRKICRSAVKAVKVIISSSRESVDVQKQSVAVQTAEVFTLTRCQTVVVNSVFSKPQLAREKCKACVIISRKAKSKKTAPILIFEKTQEEQTKIRSHLYAMDVCALIDDIENLCKKDQESKLEGRVLRLPPSSQLAPSRVAHLEAPLLKSLTTEKGSADFAKRLAEAASNSKVGDLSSVAPRELLWAVGALLHYDSSSEQPLEMLTLGDSRHRYYGTVLAKLLDRLKLKKADLRLVITSLKREPNLEEIKKCISSYFPDLPQEDN